MVALRASLAVLARLAVLLGVLCVATPALAAKVVLEVDTDSLFVGQSTGLDVIVRGGDPISEPQMRVPAGLTAEFSGQQQATTIVNGSMSRFVKFRYEITARQEGTYTIGPASVDLGGGQPLVQSNQVTVTIGAAPPRAAGANKALQVEARFNTASAWQGQVVTLYTALHTRRSLQGARWYGLPESHLLAPRDGNPTQNQYKIQDAEGPLLTQEEWTPWVVTDAGALRWDPPSLEVAIVVEDQGPGGLLGSFFQRTQRDVVTATPLALDVRPLPPAPPDFSGLVGDFELKQAIDTRRARVGSSIDWVTFLSGDGTVEGFKLPPAGDIDGARVYEGGASPNAQVKDGQYKATVRVARTLVPTRVGSVVVPDARVVVFSPTKGEYVTLTAPGATLDVKKGEDGAVHVQSFAPDGSDAPDAAAAEDAVRPMSSTGPAWRLPLERALPAAIGVAALPAIGLGALAVGRRVRARLAELRTAEPREATPTERLAALPADPVARLAALDDTLRLALAQRVGVPIAALDRQAALAQLDDQTAALVRDVLYALDRTRFAGSAAPSDLEARVRAAVTALGVA
jgi:hypothetical protein